ncbi:MAG: Hsp70 family protein [Gemmataceae bacterium]
MPASTEPLPTVGFLGIDFGTSNTHVAICYVDGIILPQSVPMAGESSTPTCLLRKEPWEDADDEDGNVLAIGDKAIQTWLTQKEEERARRRFSAGFKPDLSRLATARRDARAFLGRCCRALREGRMAPALGSQEGIPVFVGVPAEASREHQEETRRIARDAGFGDADVMDEPLGALAFHLADGSVTAAEVRQGILVIDFGGGTLDLALLDARHGLRTPWGDPTLGGRLFDDLFYQWLLEQNPELELAERDHSVVWLVAARELKEKFSRHWTAVGPEVEFVQSVPVPLRKFAEFRCGGASEFLTRASRYVPSPLAGRYFAEVGGALAELGRSGPVDLIAWIRRELERQGRLSGIGRIILTGGSSLWPFMRDLATDVFGVDAKQILVSPNPQSTIAAGLAVYRVMQHHNARKRVKLTAELPEYRQRFETDVARQMQSFSENAATAIIAPLFATVEGYYLEWYRNGGTLREVSHKVESFTASYDVKPLIREKTDLLVGDLTRLMRDHLGHWLAEHGIPRDAAEYLPEGGVGVHAPLGDPSGQIATTALITLSTALIAALVGLVYGVAHGTHILVSPLTGIVVALISGVLAAIGVKIGEGFLRDKLLDYRWGKRSLWTLRRRLSEQSLRDRIEKQRKEAVQELAARMWNGPEKATPGDSVMNGAWQSLMELTTAVVDRFELAVRNAIRDLGVFEEIRRAGK